MDFELLILENEEKMETIIENYHHELNKIVTGRANPMVLDFIKINYYDSLVKIKEIASVAVFEGVQLIIRPFDINFTKKIFAAIKAANLNIQIADEGDKIRVMFPEMTYEKRKTLVKQMANVTEHARVEVRKIRHILNKSLKTAHLSEDLEHRRKEESQELTDKFIKKIDIIKRNKEKELLTL